MTKIQPISDRHHFAGYIAHVLPYQVTREQMATWYEQIVKIWPDEQDRKVKLCLCALGGITPMELIDDKTTH
jgi:hypothetical protein